MHLLAGAPDPADAPSREFRVPRGNDTADVGVAEIAALKANLAQVSAELAAVKATVARLCTELGVRGDD